MINNLRKLIPEKDSQAFWLSLFLCLFFCSVILFVVSPITGLSKNFGAGNDGYIQLARSLAKGDGFVFEKGGPAVFHRLPLYPLFLVPVALFPENLQRYVIVIPQSILVGFIGMMTFKIAKQLYSRTVAVTALLLFLVNPWVYWNAKTPMVSVLQASLYLIFAYFVAIELFEIFNIHVRIIRSKPLPRGFIIGVFGAGLALTHAAMLPVFFIFMFILFITALFRDRRRLLTVLIAVVVTCCFIAPWTYRNRVVFGRFIPVTCGGGLDYFNGNIHWVGIVEEPQRQGEHFIDASFRIIGIEGTEETHTHWKGFKDIKLEELTNRKMFEHIKKHPVLFVKKFILNAVEYYFPALTYPFLAVKGVSLEKIALTVFHLGLWICAIIGILFRETKFSLKPYLLLLAGILLYSVWYFPFATFIGHALYAFGTIPFLCIMSAAGIVCFFRKERQTIPG
jgi:uncharacterized membrane protein YtjA (UPF0391 family)